MAKMMSLLVVDDDETFHLMFDSLCHKLNDAVTVTHIYDCASAIETINTYRFDWIVLDFMLQDGTAADILNRVNNRFNPYLILTALPVEYAKAIQLEVAEDTHTPPIHILPKSCLDSAFMKARLEAIMQKDHWHAKPKTDWRRGFKTAPRKKLEA